MKNSWEYIKIFNQNNLYTLKADSLLLTALWFFICRVSTWQCSLVSPGSLHQPSVYLQWWQHGKSNAWLANYTARENRPVEYLVHLNSLFTQTVSLQGFTIITDVINCHFCIAFFHNKCVGTNMIHVNMN